MLLRAPKDLRAVVRTRCSLNTGSSSDGLRVRLGLPRLRLSASFVRYPVLVRIFCYYSTIDADVSRMVHCMSHTGFMLFLDESGLCDIHPNEETMRAVQVPT